MAKVDINGRFKNIYSMSGAGVIIHFLLNLWLNLPLSIFYSASNILSQMNCRSLAGDYNNLYVQEQRKDWLRLPTKLSFLE